jgi:alginate O-acetyltransferase complex protein AlgI
MEPAGFSLREPGRTASTEVSPGFRYGLTGGAVQFNSLTFGLFLLPALVFYYVTPRPYRWVPLLVASYVFYAVTDSTGIAVLIGLTLSSYGIARALSQAKTPANRRRLLWLGLALILLALVGFRSLTALVPGPGAFAVPLGLSFFTLRLAGYLIDVARNTTGAERHLGAFSLYVAVFPELPAGPIERAGSLLPQLQTPADLRYERITSGVKLFAWGLLKKVVIADRLRLFVDAVYDAPGAFDGAAYAVATLFFAFQIYGDFSGYSDMAIGLGEMFGLRFAKNFDRPYSAKSIAEFWTRWHISFSSWLRDYVFLPLVYKTSRAVEGRLPRAISEEKLSYGVAAVTTMALCGAWHGATLNYVTWGVVVGAYMVSSVLTRKIRARIAKRLYGRQRRRLHDAVRIATTFLLVNVSWVFFRSNSLGDAAHMIASIPGGVVSYCLRAFSGLAAGSVAEAGLTAPFRLGQSGFDLLLAVAGVIVLLAVEWLQTRGSVREFVGACPLWVRWPLYVTLVLAIVVFRAPAGTKFIYAGF